MRMIRFRGIEVSPVGIGTAAWGSGINGGVQMYGKTVAANDQNYIFRQAVAQGINLFDSSPSFGSSETSLGYASQSNKSVLFSTKFVPSGFQRKNAMRKSLMNSIRELGVSSIDFYCIQSPADIEKWTAELIPLMDDGLVKFVGVANHNIRQIMRAQAVLEEAGKSLAFVQNHYSLLSHEEKDEGIIQWCRDNNALFMSYMVLEQGALTLRYSSATPFDPASFRGKTYNTQILNALEPLKLLMGKIAEGYYVSEAQVAMAWCMERGAIPIIGVTKSSHIGGITSSLNFELDDADLRELEETADGIGIRTYGYWELDGEEGPLPTFRRKGFF